MGSALHGPASDGETLTGTLLKSVDVCVASCALRFKPQDWSERSPSRTTTCSEPAAMSFTLARASPTGAALDSAVPFPSWPTLFAPQASRVPSAQSAIEWPLPAAKLTLAGVVGAICCGAT